MTKKKRKSKDEQPAQNFESQVEDAFQKLRVDMEGNESGQDKPDLTEISPTEADSVEEKPGAAETAAAESEAESGASGSEELSQPQDAETSDEVSMDDLLDDVRRSLIEDEAQSEEKKSGWLSRIARGFQKDHPTTESPVEDEAVPLVPDVPAESSKDDPYVDEIDELIEILEPKAAEAETKPEPVQQVELTPILEPESPPPDMEELKKRVFSPREGSEVQEISEVRSVVLEGDGGEDVFVEVEARKEDTAQDRLKAFENSLRPYRQYLYFAVAFLGVVLIVVTAGIMYTYYQRTRPPEPTPVESNLPYPIAMSLPGGLDFNLAKGSITDGKWNPQGPEWLRGTEICRWVAIPWSKQLEAVVRTLTPDDSIELVMSNNDKLEYQVYAREELTLAEMQALDQNSPCLLLVLAKQDAEKRWVVTAKP